MYFLVIPEEGPIDLFQNNDRNVPYGAKVFIFHNRTIAYWMFSWMTQKKGNEFVKEIELDAQTVKRMLKEYPRPGERSDS